MRAGARKVIAMAALGVTAGMGAFVATSGTANAMQVCDCGGGTWYGSFPTLYQAMQFEQELVNWQANVQVEIVFIQAQGDAAAQAAGYWDITQN